MQFLLVRAAIADDGTKPTCLIAYNEDITGWFETLFLKGPYDFFWSNPAFRFSVLACHLLTGGFTTPALSRRTRFISVSLRPAV